MCRFYIYSGVPKADLHRALKLAAERDPYAPGDLKHGDGWGYAVYLMNGSVAYYRSSSAIWKDPHIPPLGIAGLSHVRAASPGEPVGVIYSHPFQVHTEDGRILYVAHNGSVDKREMGRLLGLDPSRFSDSWILAAFLASSWDDPESALTEAEQFVKTALNLAIMELPGPRLYAYNYFKSPEEKREAYEAYYRLYRVAGEGWEAVTSSSLVRHLEGRAEPLEPEKLYILPLHGL